MRIFVSADIEGTGGFVLRDQGRHGGHEYQEACRRMTDEVLAVCDAAHNAGAEEVVVADSHGNGCNIEFGRMPDYVQLVRAWPRPLGMMQGIEAGIYAGALLIGYHAASHNPAGILSHTLSSDLFQEVSINGRLMSEASLSAAIAGHFGVPILMASGDDVFVREAREMLGNLSIVKTKIAYGTSSARNFSSSAVLPQLAQATETALSGALRTALYLIDRPALLTLRLRSRAVADWLEYLPNVTRSGAFSVQVTLEDIVAVSRFLMFVVFARPAFA